MISKIGKIILKKHIHQIEGGYAWPGGYPIYGVMQDGGCLCSNCVKENRRQIYLDSLEPSGHTGWELLASEINWEDMQLNCDNCYMEIECAYPDESKRKYQNN